MNQTGLPGQAGQEGRKLGNRQLPTPLLPPSPLHICGLHGNRAQLLPEDPGNTAGPHSPHTELCPPHIGMPGATTARTDLPLFRGRLCAEEKGDGRKPGGSSVRVPSAASPGRGDTPRPQPRSDVTPSQTQAERRRDLALRQDVDTGQEAQRGAGQRRGGNGMKEESQGGLQRLHPTPTTALPATRPAAGPGAGGAVPGLPQ